MNNRQRISVALLTMSAAAFSVWQADEGWSSAPIIPVKGDVPTIGHGSTRYEDGTRVRMTDPPITRERGAQLARNLHSEEEVRFRASIAGVKLHQEEYDEYLDFTGQFGIGNWRSSPMRKELQAGNYVQACHALLQYRFVNKFDCSTPGNRVCRGVWTRQQKRHKTCMAAQ